MNKIDISSFSNSHEVIIVNIDWKVNVDFEKHIFKVTAIYTFNILEKSVKNIVLDTMNIDIIHKIIINDEICYYEIDNNHKYKEELGCPLIITIPSTIDLALLNSIKMQIDYETSSCANAVNFLDSNQTLSKKHPFMFTQSEPIYTRSFLPCQDTPSVKFTSECEITTPNSIVGLYSGILKSSNKEITAKQWKHTYVQNVPIPSYLIAIACGDIHSKVIDNSNIVIHSEKEILQKSIEEFSETSKFMEIAESYIGHPYAFKTFDILILPPSFPYGGMENPNLTFLNPSVIVGDKSSVHVVAHELAHAWTGNLVTNCNWKNFFVNEGFTVFLERKILKKYYCYEMCLNDSSKGLKALNETINNLLNRDIELSNNNNNANKKINYKSFTTLQPELEGVNPDDCFSNVPYEKGYQFLVYLESLIGEEHFQNVFRKYIKNFAYKSIDFENGFFKLYKDYINNTSGLMIDIEYLNTECKKWLFSSGLCPNNITIESSSESNIKEIILKISNSSDGFDSINKLFETSINELWFNKWDACLKILFIQLIYNNESIIEDIDNQNKRKAIFNNLNKLFSIYKNNSELCINDDVLCEWYKLNLLFKRKDNIKDIQLFLSSRGRMKYVKPLLVLYHKLDKDECLKFYNNTKQFYHSILIGILNRLFDI